MTAKVHTFKASLIVAPDLYRAECDCGEWDAEGPRDCIIPRWQEHLDNVYGDAAGSW